MIEDKGKYDKIKLANLLDAMQDDTLSEKDETELQEILKSSKKARKTYLENTSLEDSLYWSSAENSILPFPEKLESAPEKAVSLNTKVILLFAAALLTSVVIIGVLLKGVNVSSSSTVATVHEGPNVSWGSKNIVSKQLEVGKYNLVSGIAEIVFDSGTRMKVFSPAEFELSSYNHARLLKGEVRIKVPEEALGFRLVTEAANFVDIGTEFTVKVNDSQIAELHVLEGVVIARPNRGQTVVSFGKNESGRVEPVFGEVVTIQSKYKSRDPLAPDSTPSKYSKIHPKSKVIFLGDRNTDFETYLHMVNQAIFDAEPENAPTLLNAGMTLRLFNTANEFKELFADLKPSHAVLAFGSEIATNDGEKAKYQISPNDFEMHIKKTIKRLLESNIKPIIMTGYPMKTGNPVCLKLLAAYNRTLRQIAAEGNFPLAEADVLYDLYKNSETASQLVDNDEKYSTFEGYRVIARSVLNSFGYNNLEVPRKLRYKMLPGVIREWYATDSILKSDQLSKEEIANLNYKSWDKIHLPQPAQDKISTRLLVPHQTYPIQARSLGAAMSITKDYRNKTRAVAEVYSENGGKKYINLGEDIKAVWVNGEQLQKEFLGIYVDGRHPGFYRLPIILKKGLNKIIIEASNSFFVSITNNIDWGLPHPVWD